MSLLRHGSAFDVYDAWSLERRCRCVVKMLAPGVSSAGLRRRLLLEGRLLTRLDHPHLLRGYEVRTDPPLVASRMLTGYTLGGLLDLGHRVGGMDLAALGGQLCSALHYLHGSGYLHLDVKPGNVAVDGGLAVLFDVSLAQRPGRVGRGTGTARYMSPEQARGGVVGPAADVWGLGITLYEAACGLSPFAAAGERLGAARPTHVLDSADDRDDRDGARSSGRGGNRWQPAQLPQLTGRAPTIRRRRRFPADLSAAVDACLEPDPAARPSVDELAAVFAGYTGDGPPVPGSRASGAPLG